MRAQLWTQQEKLDEAVKDLDEAAKLDPDDLGLLLMRARLYHAAGRNALAQQDVERVLQTRPDVRPAIELRSSILAAMGKFAEAAKDITELLKKEPANILLKLQLAIYLNAGNQSRQAIEVFGEVLQADPQNGIAPARAGRRVFECRRTSQSRRRLRSGHQDVRRRLGDPQ